MNDPGIDFEGVSIAMAIAVASVFAVVAFATLCMFASRFISQQLSFESPCNTRKPLSFSPDIPMKTHPRVRHIKRDARRYRVG